MPDYFNRMSEKDKRRDLRNSMPPAEVLLWQQLRRQQLGGYKFRRQYSVGSYVIDFYCTQMKLAIELDGESHFVDGAAQYDATRQAFIEQFGIRFLRFTNVDVYENMEGILYVILKSLNNHQANSSPIPQGS